MVLLFSATLLVSATLLFFVQPMVGKMLLPLLGGTPAVWNTCMVFFQFMLLAGYSYAHFTVKFFGLKRQSALHVFVLFFPLLLLPIALTDNPDLPTGSNPIGWLFWQLLIWVGLPFFVVSASAPLLQKWFASLDHLDSEDPYFLYSASNFGSLIALLAYPFVVEPALDLETQSRFWMYGYLALMAFTAFCAYCVQKINRKGDEAVNAGKTFGDAPEQTNSALLCIVVTPSDRILWVAAALVSSSLMLGVTTSMTTDIAAVPLLWVIPLAIYLLTFTLVFAKKPPLSHRLMVRMLPFAVLLITPFLFTYFTIDFSERGWLLLPLHLGVFFIAAMVCHGILAERRPDPTHLTEFYLWISIGGVLGGIINAIVAPLIFSSLMEYPVMLVIACALPGFGKDWRSGLNNNDFLLPAIVLASGLCLSWLFQLLGFGKEQFASLLVFLVPTMICFHFRLRPLRFSMGLAAVMLAFVSSLTSHYDHILTINRNFFGVKRVVVSDSRKLHMLIHGGTTHGYQSTEPALRRVPMAYFHPSGPIGDVFAEISVRDPKTPVAIIGLGTGAMAAYAAPGQLMQFYEIDPMIYRIAGTPAYFSYLEDCLGDCRVALGDGRLNLAKAGDRSFGAIILDAFSSDSIPTHLVTREAIRLYLRKLDEGGVIAFHITNRYLDMVQLLGNLAEDSGLVAYTRKDFKVSRDEFREGKAGSQYVVMARSKKDLGDIAANPQWKPISPKEMPVVWTDRFSNILSVIKW